jgi:hypothetical protein
MLRSLMLGLVLLVGAAMARAEAPAALMYKNPQCGCCEEYAKYLRANGFKVTVKESRNMSLISRQNGVPEKLAGCHTTLIGGYVVEGHVPVGAITRLLKERPAIKGISLPGMPAGSPGMTGVKSEPFTIYEISDDPKVFAVE